MNDNNKSMPDYQDLYKKKVNKDEVLDGYEVAELFEDIVKMTGHSMYVVNGLIALLHTIRKYADSDAPHMIDDLVIMPQIAVFQYTRHFDIACKEACERLSKVFKDTDYRKDDRDAKLQADVADFESKLEIDRTERQKRLDSFTVQKEVDLFEKIKQSVSRKKGKKRETEVL